MGKIFQVRYTVGDKTVAHEHYTEKGGRSDAKALSKVIGNSMMGEIDIADDGVQTMVRVWEFTGGEMGKPIKKEGPPSPVEVLKNADETRVSEGKVEKKPKAPRLSDEEKIAQIKADAEAKLKAISEGTFVLPVKGRKAGTTTSTKKPKAEVDRVAKLVEDLKCSERAARIISGAQLNATGRRVRVALGIINAEGPILASKIVEDLNSSGKEDRTVDIDDIMAAVQHINFLFVRENQPLRITIQDRENDKRLNLVPVRVEYEEEDDDDTTSETGGEAAA
jgi:hypothetical protein